MHALKYIISQSYSHNLNYIILLRNKLAIIYLFTFFNLNLNNFFSQFNWLNSKTKIQNKMLKSLLCILSFMFYDFMMLLYIYYFFNTNLGFFIYIICLPNCPSLLYPHTARLCLSFAKKLTKQTPQIISLNF